MIWAGNQATEAGLRVHALSCALADATWSASLLTLAAICALHCATSSEQANAQPAACTMLEATKHVCMIRITADSNTVAIRVLVVR